MTISCRIAVLVCLCLAPIAPAQQSGDSSIARNLISPKIATLEDEIAHLSQARLDAPPEAKSTLDLRIDLRISARAILLLARDSRPESQGQINAYLHGRQLLTIIPQV